MKRQHYYQVHRNKKPLRKIVSIKDYCFDKAIRYYLKSNRKENPPSEPCFIDVTFKTKIWRGFIIKNMNK